MKIESEIAHLVSAVVFSAVIWILYPQFGGEFIIMHNGLWIFIIFTVLFVCNPIFFLVLKILNEKKQKPSNLERIPSYVIFCIVWNFIIASLLLTSAIYLVILVVDSVSVIEIIVLVLAFVFYSTVLIYNNVKLLIDKSKGKELHFDKGMVVTGLVFLFLATSFSLKIAVYNPQWTDGVTHTALFSRGDQKGHSYRIPSLIILPGDILLAFSESRIHAMLDWGDIDLVMKRSIDGGQTWSDLTIIRDEGKRTAGNPCPVFDNDTQTVWLPYCVDNKEVYIMNSTDYGLTWSTPREITQDLNLDLSGSTSKLDMEYGTGPGNGIQLSSGRLVIPSYYIDKKMAHVIYSDDNGQTWEKGEDLTIGEEPQVFEGVNSSLCINCRTIEDYRYVAWSSDGGETWGTPYLHQELPEIGCMASVSRFTSTITHTQNRILFSNPIQNSRGHLTIRLSYDEGLTWNVSKLIFEGPTAYSHIAILSDYTICMLFEQGRYDYRQIIQFCSFTLDWLTDGQDTLVAI